MVFNLKNESAFDYRAVTDPRDGRRVALKKLPNVFQSLVSSKRVFRELKMLCFFKHENVSGNGKYSFKSSF